MAATEPPLSTTEKPKVANQEAKTIYNILSHLKETDPNPDNQIFTSTKLETDDDDILILKKDPGTNQTSINKSAYLKLHRNVSPNRSSTIDKFKEKYEKTDDETDKVETIESLKNKYSPSGLGYKPNPAPKPRRSKLSRSQIITPKKEAKAARLSLNIEKNKHKDVNSNHLSKSQEDLSGEDEFVTIITRSDSEESVLRFQKELSAFTMDKKKRANSFRRIFSVFSNKDKKKKQEDKNKSQNKENGDNFHNESSFTRQAPYRHTTGGENKSIKSNFIQRKDGEVPKQCNDEQLEKDYAQMHINQFNHYKQNFEKYSEKTPEDGKKLIRDVYTPMDKPIYKSNDVSNTYVNMPSISKYIDTSSSASTLESDRSNIYQNEVLLKAHQSREEEVEVRNYSLRFNDGRRDTPPRLLETKQDVRLVNPKALIPINSERSLPNPYQNGNRESLNISKGETPRLYLDETYGTVFDSLENRKHFNRKTERGSLSPKDHDKPPRPPSVEPTKLKLPPNREIVPLSPRVRSPIPPDHVSTEKLIATELLKPKRSPTPTKKAIAKADIPSHQRLEIDIDYPDNINRSDSFDNIMSKPPVSAKPLIQQNARLSTNMSQASRSSIESVLRHRMSQASPISSDRIVTNAQVHTNSPIARTPTPNQINLQVHTNSPSNRTPTPSSSLSSNQNNLQIHSTPSINRTPTPNNSLPNQNLSLSPVRPMTPSGSQIPESPKTSPQKQDMRKSVEAYYWKEIKKLKDQENYDLYLYQMQYEHMSPYGYAEDPVSVRRSRSMSPSANRNGRRSLSLPREPKQQTQQQYYPNPIPENRAVPNQVQPRSVQQLQFQQQQYFQRNAPERSTIDGSPRKYDGNSLYRPIFKRGSLSTPPRQTDDSLKRKVSFSGSKDQNGQSWPTKNGHTQSPPQRRLESQGDDEVFFPNDIRYRQPNANTRPEDMYYNTKQNIIGPKISQEPTYVLRANQNSLYLHHTQPPESTYGQRTQRRLPNPQEEALYGQPLDAVRPKVVPPGMTRHGSIQIQEELYGPRRMSYQSNIPSVPSTPVSLPQENLYVSRRPPSVQPIRREIIMNDEIFGQFGGYNRNNRNAQPQNVYASRQSIAEYNSRVRDEYYNRPPQKQVSVSNKVCDIYGQIHDSNPNGQQSGVIMGQLHPGSPPVVRSSYSHLAGRENFVRNSRLTASASDMYRRVQTIPQARPNEALYGRIDQHQMQNGVCPPNRPLPPVPLQSRGSVKGVVRNHMVSDTESGSDASEIQKILNSSAKTKKRGIFGK